MGSRAFGSRVGARSHLTTGKRGVAGEVADLRRDVDAAFDSLEHDLVGSSVVEVTTTTAAANQVLASYPVPENGLLVLDVVARGNKEDTADGVTARLSGSFKRNGDAAPERIGTDDSSIKKTDGLAIDGTSGVTLVISGNAVEVQASPGEVVTLKWLVALQGVGGPTA